MRKGSRAAVIGFLLATAGCGGEEFHPPGEHPEDDSASGTGGSDGSGGEGGTDGAGGSEGVGGASDGGAGGGCDPEATPDVASCVVDDDFGVFVRTEGDDTAAGTKDAPVRTLAKAVELASNQKKRVYACAQTFAESIVVPGGVEIYGGLACSADWSWKSGDLTRVEAPSPMAIHVTGGTATARLVDLLVVAAHAATPGASSIAVYADGTPVDLERCQLFAGNGVAGTAGTDASSVPAISGVKGNTGKSACLSDVTPGAAKETNQSCSTSVGGAGGVGSASFGSSGIDGLPALGGGAGGKGQPSSGNWACFTVLGAPWGAGMTGASASAAAAGPVASPFGILQAATGFVAADGHDGTPGSPGQGGGGGGGTGGICGPDAPDGGASGASGGSGGCGGNPGGGGQGGGSSIALAIRSAAVSMVDVALFTGDGAPGGKAGRGQPGGIGGDGGVGGLASGVSPAGCPGGKGGSGGHGGPGSGGAGGHSIAVLHLGSPPEMQGVTFTLGSAADGGAGLIGLTPDDVSAPGGPAGKSEEVVSL